MKRACVRPLKNWVIEMALTLTLANFNGQTIIGYEGVCYLGGGLSTVAQGISNGIESTTFPFGPSLTFSSTSEQNIVFGNQNGQTTTPLNDFNAMIASIPSPPSLADFELSDASTNSNGSAWGVQIGNDIYLMTTSTNTGTADYVEIVGPEEAHYESFSNSICIYKNGELVINYTYFVDWVPLGDDPNSAGAELTVFEGCFMADGNIYAQFEGYDDNSDECIVILGLTTGTITTTPLGSVLVQSGWFKSGSGWIAAGDSGSMATISDFAISTTGALTPPPQLAIGITGNATQAEAFGANTTPSIVGILAALYGRTGDFTPTTSDPTLAVVLAGEWYIPAAALNSDGSFSMVISSVTTGQSYGVIGQLQSVAQYQDYFIPPVLPVACLPSCED